MCQAVVASNIITLSPAINEIAFAIGGGNLIVGSVEYANYPQNSLPKVGSYTNVSVENIVALKPSIVISQIPDERLAKRLHSFGISMFSVKLSSLQDIKNAILQIGIWLNKEQNSVRMVDEINLEFAKLVQSKKLGKKALVVYGTRNDLAKGIYVATSSQFVGEIAKASGLDIDNSSTQMSLEQILQYNPDVVVILAHDNKSLREWQKLPINAAKLGNIYTISNDYAFIPSNRVVLLMQDFKKIVANVKMH